MTDQPDVSSDLDARRTAALRKYMTALDAGDYPAIRSLFVDDGLVTSPFLGTMAAVEFFAKLELASSGNVITPIDIFLSQAGADRAVAYFQYHWTMADDSVVVFNVMDLFGFESGSDRFTKLDIIYDTHPIRAEHGDKYERLASDGS